MRILFVASEALPYAKTGGLADVIEALPRALVKLGHEVGVFIPRYRGMKTTSVDMPSMTVPQGTRLRFPAIANGGLHRGVRYFLLDDPFYFDREGIYGDKNREYPDNAERFTEFSRAAIELAKQLWMPDLIHCHDWQTAMVPVLLRTSYSDDPAVRNVPIVFTIHNMGYHGIFPREALERAGIPAGVFHPGGIEFFGNVNFLKGGLIYSDYLTTVSRKYAEGQSEPSRSGNRLALRRSKRLRPHCSGRGGTAPRRCSNSSAGFGRPSLRRIVPRAGQRFPGTRRRGHRLRQSVGALSGSWI
jgi:starch synthase